jgi:hypothetical protein
MISSPVRIKRFGRPFPFSFFGCQAAEWIVSTRVHEQVRARRGRANKDPGRCICRLCAATTLISTGETVGDWHSGERWRWPA